MANYKLIIEVQADSPQQAVDIACDRLNMGGDVDQLFLIDESNFALDVTSQQGRS